MAVPISCGRCGAVKSDDQPITCTVLEGGPCSPCKERIAIRHQIKQLEEEIMKLWAKHATFGTMMNAIHDPYIHKFPAEIASRILRLSLPALNDREHDPHATYWPRSVRKGWAAPLKLGSVCRMWRQLAWATPDLWTNLYIRIKRSTTRPTAETLPGLLREWLTRSGVLPLTIYFFPGYKLDVLDSSGEEDSYEDSYEDSSGDDTNLRVLEISTVEVMRILNLHSGQWRNLHLKAPWGEIFRNFFSHSSVQPNQLASLELVAKAGQSPAPTQFTMDSDINLTHLKLLGFPLTSINIRWDTITHATFHRIAAVECLDFLQKASSLEFYCVRIDRTGDVALKYSIIHPRLRSLDLIADDPPYFLDAINLPSLEEWTRDMLLRPVAPMLSLLKRSNCCLKVINLKHLFPSSEDLNALLQAMPSLESMRLSSEWLCGGTRTVMDDILTRIFHSLPGSNISAENPISEPFLPHLRLIQCETDDFVCHAFSWSRIPELYRLGHRRSLRLKGFAAQSNISDRTALQLLQLTEEGMDLHIVDTNTGEDFLQNFRKRMCMRSV